MGPETITALALLVTAVLGGSGVAVFRRRGGEGQLAAGAEVRAATPALVELADALADATDKITRVESRVTALEGCIWRCPVGNCPLRAKLRSESS